jgi:hypothetical protein
LNERFILKKKSSLETVFYLSGNTYANDTVILKEVGGDFFGLSGANSGNRDRHSDEQENEMFLRNL